MIEIKSDFIGKFKLGDNINHNLKILEVLYSYYSNDQNNRMFLNKPIILTIVSIIEAVLYDFHLKAKLFTSEGITGLPTQILEYIRNKKLDKLEQYIASAKKHDFFDLADTDFYDALEELRKLRNRIHIQNEKNYFEDDESRAFCGERKKQAEMVLEKVMTVMSAKFSRGDKFHHVENFILPWNTHF